MLRYLYTIILSAALCPLVCVAVSAQETEPVQKKEATAVNLTFESAKETKDETASPSAEKSVENKLEAAPLPRPVFNLKRVGVNQEQTTPLTLNEAIRRALENNNNIEVARNDVRVNETILRSFEGIYDPVIALTPTFTRNTGARQGRSTNDFSLNLGFDQFLPMGGGRISPFFNNSRTGSFFSTNNPVGTTQVVSSGAFFSSSLGVQYTQPLLRNRAIDQNRRNIKIQRKRLEQSDADFRRQTIETIAQVQRSYWDLVFALRDQQNRVANLNLTKENLRRVQAQIAAGSAAPLAEAEVATELANRESDLLLAQQQVSVAENTLKQLILKEISSPEWTAQIIPIDEPNFDSTPVKLEDAMAEAKENRPELQRLKLESEVNNIDVDFYKNQTKPQIDLVNTFSLNGFTQSGASTDGSSTTLPLIAGDPAINSSAFLLGQINVLRNNAGLGNASIPNVTTNAQAASNGGFFPSIRNLFNSNSPTFSVGVSIGFPLRNKTAKANLAGAEIQRTQIGAQTRQQEQTVIAEVRNSVQAVETARLRIATAQTARINAEKQLQGEQKLYEVGRSTTFLLFQRENALANARNAEIRAQTDYNKSLADLQRATSTTLRSNNIVIESVVAP